MEQWKKDIFSSFKHLTKQSACCASGYYVIGVLTSVLCYSTSTPSPLFVPIANSRHTLYDWDRLTVLVSCVQVSIFTMHLWFCLDWPQPGVSAVPPPRAVSAQTQVEHCQCFLLHVPRLLFVLPGRAVCLHGCVGAAVQLVRTLLNMYIRFGMIDVNNYAFIYRCGMIDVNIYVCIYRCGIIDIINYSCIYRCGMIDVYNYDCMHRCGMIDVENYACNVEWLVLITILVYIDVEWLMFITMIVYIDVEWLIVITILVYIDVEWLMFIIMLVYFTAEWLILAKAYTLWCVCYVQ